MVDAATKASVEWAIVVSMECAVVNELQTNNHCTNDRTFLTNILPWFNFFMKVK